MTTKKETAYYGIFTLQTHKRVSGLYGVTAMAMLKEALTYADSMDGVRHYYNSKAKEYPRRSTAYLAESFQIYQSWDIDEDPKSIPSLELYHMTQKATLLATVNLKK
jgi:hypothetical protein